MFDIVNPKNSYPVPLYYFFQVFLYPQGIIRGGICVTTVDPADIRGLVTAFHGFVAELPQSSVGSLAWGPFP